MKVNVYIRHIRVLADLSGRVFSMMPSSATNPSIETAALVSGEWTRTQATAIGSPGQPFVVNGIFASTTGGTLALEFRTESTSGSNTATLQALTHAVLVRRV